MFTRQYSILLFEQSLRRTLRGLLMCMSFCFGLAVAAFTPPHGWSDALSPVFVGLVFGVPGGLIVYPVYRLLRFALGR
jgi:hypothetical protein